MSAIVLALLANPLAHAAATAAPATADRPAPATTLTLQPYAGRLRTLALTLGGVTLRMLFDTGAGLTVVTPAVAARLGCAPTGRTVGWRMSGERVEFPLCGATDLQSDGYHERLRNYGIFDLGRVLPADLPPLDGVVGLDAFAGRTIVLQLAQQRLVVEPDGTAPGPDWTEVPMRTASGVDGATTVVFLGASGPANRLAWLELDSGNLDTVLLSPSGAALLGEAPAAQAPESRRLTFGTLVTDPLPVTPRDLLHDGALNAQFLERYDLRLSLAARRAWLRAVAH